MRLSEAVSRHVSAPVSFEVLEVGPVRLEASPARMYRRWSEEAKARIVDESLAPAAKAHTLRQKGGSCRMVSTELASNGGSSNPCGCNGPLRQPIRA